MYYVVVHNVYNINSVIRFGCTSCREYFDDVWRGGMICANSVAYYKLLPFRFGIAK